MLALLVALVQTATTQAPAAQTPAAASPSVADFFPLVPGTVRTYNDFAGSTRASTDEIGQPIDVAGAPATPLLTKDQGRTVGTLLYRIEGNIVFLVGVDPKKPFPAPIPVLQFDGKQGKWQFQGTMGKGIDAEPLVITGEAKLLKDQVVLGKKVPVIQATMKVLTGVGRTQQADEQTMLYAKGIGMFKANSTTRIGKQAITSTRTLIQVEEAKTTG